jgi:hypothetical protein
MPDQPQSRGGFSTHGEYVTSLDEAQGLVRAGAKVSYSPLPADIFLAAFSKSASVRMTQIVDVLRTGGSMELTDIGTVVPIVETALSSEIWPCRSFGSC